MGELFEIDPRLLPCPDIIEVITGVHRCGKSSLMQMIATEDREYRSPEKIRDNYHKYLLTTDYLPQIRGGIRHVNLMDFMKFGFEF